MRIGASFSRRAGSGQLKAVTTAALTAAALALPVESASAATVLFADGFKRSASESVGNGWTELEQDGNDVGIVLDNYLLLRDSLSGTADAAAASAVIDATGYENITVMFRWRALTANEADDTLQLAFALDPAPAMTDTGAWSTVFSEGYDDGINRTSAVSLGSGADNVRFNMMFWTDATETTSGNNEGFRLSWVKVTGDRILVNSLPGSLPLILAGLFGFGFMAWRKRSA